MTSQDGGDTIKYEPIGLEDAMMAFKEQRVRYNRKVKKGGEITSLAWSMEQTLHGSGDDEDKAVPDFIAAAHYRRKQRGLPKTVLDAATKLKNSGSIRTSDIIAVHPGRHEDPRAMGHVGTHSLRRSKSEFESQYAFSIVTRLNHRIPTTQKSSRTTVAASEKWHSGEGSDTQFRTIDFETATEGEYWLVFRGFLLLHRDAASGRYASHRAAGFGSNYRDHEDKENALQKDAYHEPRNVGFMEKFIADCRKIDLSLEMNGSAEPGAVPPPSDYFLGFRSPGTQIWSRLRQAGLETSRIYGIDTRRVMIKVKCPADRLTDVAEVLRIKLKTKNGTYAPFRENAMATFLAALQDDDDTSSSSSLFRSAERQKVIDFIIRSRIRDSGGELGQTTELGKQILVRVPLHMKKRLDKLYHAWGCFWKRSNWVRRNGRSLTVDQDESEGADVSYNGSTPNWLTRFFVGCFHQPLDSIEEYYGEKVTFYFAWLQHCSYHLIFLSIVGFIVTICMYTSNNWDHPIRPFYSLAVMLWSFYVLVKWRQRSNLLAHRWGTMDIKVQETTRPTFKGEYRRDTVTGEWIVYYPSWKRYLKYLISFPITLAFTIGTLLLILIVHANRDIMLARYFDQKENPGSEEYQTGFTLAVVGKTKPIRSVELNSENLSDPQFWFIIAGLPSLLGLSLPLLNFILMRISVMLTNFENYRTETHYRTALIVKVFSFRFVCYFATLYYYCFLGIGDEKAIENGILRVGTGVFVYITVAHYWGIFIQIYFPLMIYHIRRRKQKKKLHEELMQVEREEAELEDLTEEEANNEDIQEKKIHLVNKRLLLDQAQDALWQETMLPQHDSFPEYIQAVIQFCYVTCFSVVLPITPMICLVNHLISMRLDAYKLCRTRKRPLAVKTGGIGVWEHVLHIVTVIAILTNCALMGFTNVLFTKLANSSSGSLGEVGVFAIVVGWEHVMLLIKYVMQTSTPKLPKSVRDEMAKEQYETDRKRTTSMIRAKRDRRSRGDIFVSPRNNNNNPDSPEDDKENRSLNATPTRYKGRPSAPPDSLLRQNTEGPHGLMTIPSEEYSPDGPATPSSEATALQPVDMNTTRTASTVDEDDICVPTPFHLGQSMDAEVVSPSNLRKRRPRISDASADDAATALAAARQEARRGPLASSSLHEA